ncbi:MAG TPA: hypothetical protein VGL89_04255 [Candidatus Koribacter sp.]
MTCIEGDKLKDEVLGRIEEYLAAEQAQNSALSFDEEFTRQRTEMAHCTLTEARRRYWNHIKYHRCDTAAIISLESVPVSAIAV